MAIQVVILSGGAGTRMKSKLPKVLHCLAGKPLIEYVILKALAVSESRTPLVVYSPQTEEVHKTFEHYPVRWVKQQQPLGTGHALLQALPHINKEDRVLTLCGDVPLLAAETLIQLIQLSTNQIFALLTATLKNPKGYGRIKRNAQNQIIKIVEEKEAAETDRLITEINAGVYCVPATYLHDWLPKLSRENTQQEYYLTEMIEFAAKENVLIKNLELEEPEEMLGVNDRLQLMQLERFYQRKLAEKLLLGGVTLYDATRLDIRGEVEIGKDSTIDVNAILEGTVKTGENCHIGAHTYLRNVTLGNNVKIRTGSILDGTIIADDCTIGPYARLRPGTVLQKGAHIGNFVEIKNSEIGKLSKINHLSYIGDTEMGNQVNVGAGTITCNYDGTHKHKTIIGDRVFIGSDSQLVAPVTIEAGASIGAGSTIVKNVPGNQLTLTHQLNQRSLYKKNPENIQQDDFPEKA